MATIQQQIIRGDSAKELKKIKDNTIDAVITDPPYGIEFLGKDWDKNTGAMEIWSECLRILKPGGYLLAFSAARTYHHLATNIESVGFEIRDQLMWLYASGFPKAQQIKDFPGWKTQLKPAHEPICMARKPVEGAQYQNMANWGVGALNIDATRIPYENEKDLDTYVNNIKGPLERSTAKAGDNVGMFDGNTGFRAQKGKVVMRDELAKMKRTTGSNRDTFRNFSPEQRTHKDQTNKNMDHGLTEVVYAPNDKGRFPSNVIGEVEGYQKYFYCPKVTQRERNRGCEDREALPLFKDRHKDAKALGSWADKRDQAHRNNHPTVKPVELMKYLVRLVTPAEAHIVDPFCGSGSTGMACKELGRSFTGIELDKGYCEIAEQRIAATHTDPKHTLFE